MDRDELPDEIYRQILEIYDTACAFEDDDEFESAISSYQSALALLPEPADKWNTSIWLLTAIGDCLFFSEKWEEALTALQQAAPSPGQLGNPYIHLRLGQCHFELQNFDEAADQLMRAYIVDGEDVFSVEDPKYFAFLKTRAIIE